MATKKKESAEKTAGARNIGRVVQVIGPVLDVEFQPEHLPELYNALRVDYAGDGAAPIHLVAEVQQHIGRNQVYRALVETAAAFLGAQRTAMKNATDNAGEIIELLQRTYNRARQAQITQEIAEIVGGAEALKG